MTAIFSGLGGSKHMGAAFLLVPWKAPPAGYWCGKGHAGYDICTVQELLGHADVSTTMNYTYVPNKWMREILNPLDTL